MALTLNSSNHHNNVGGIRMNLRESLKGLYCPFHSRGYCKFGSDCSFSHDCRSSLRVPDNVCYFNLTKQCFSGDECRFLHIDAITLLGLHDYGNNSSTTTTNTNSTNNHLTASSNSSNNSTSSSSSTSSSKTSDHIKRLPTTINTINNCNNGSSSNNISSSQCLASSSNNNNLTTVPTKSTIPTSNNNSSNNVTSNTITATSKQSTTSNSSSVNKLGAWSSPLQITPSSNSSSQPDKRSLPLCPFARVSDHCPQEQCTYLHGDKCDFCNCLCLHPHDDTQREVHREECIKEHEREMEQAFAIQRSSDKACGICMDIIMDKELPVERRFGILEKCDHVFCLTCIRKWRQTEQLDKKTIRSCPECRIFSAFVIPSQYWYDSGEEKDRLITNYKKALSQKPCKHFNQGQGTCPFAGACFYLHAYPDGRKVDMPPPTTRRRNNNDSDSTNFRNMLLWNYLELREDNGLLTLDYVELLDDYEDRDLFAFSDTEYESDSFNDIWDIL